MHVLLWECALGAVTFSHTGAEMPAFLGGFPQAKEIAEGPMITNAEQRLIYYLMTGYEPAVRPVKNASTTVTVLYGLTLTNILDLVRINYAEH